MGIGMMGGTRWAVSVRSPRSARDGRNSLVFLRSKGMKLPFWDGVVVWRVFLIVGSQSRGTARVRS